jgi:hypothetical protein
VLYGKDAEGAPYKDGTGGKLHDDDMVKPQTTFTYVWQVMGLQPHGCSSLAMQSMPVDGVRSSELTRV